jgi:hypothetical protein
VLCLGRGSETTEGTERTERRSRNPMTKSKCQRNDKGIETRVGTRVLSFTVRTEKSSQQYETLRVWITEKSRSGSLVFPPGPVLLRLHSMSVLSFFCGKIGFRFGD